ncbi:hypothetical protein [Streptomyces sp. NPDC001604]|uniref:hypothetical protein n=1 Tax=Streptomyces sp. NPDC001604 TaxID=3364593 RepID=UPI0036974AF8
MAGFGGAFVGEAAQFGQRAPVLAVVYEGGGAPVRSQHFRPVFETVLTVRPGASARRKGGCSVCELSGRAIFRVGSRSDAGGKFGTNAGQRPWAHHVAVPTRHVDDIK